MVPEVIYESEGLVAVNKPAGLLVHRTGAREERGEPTLAEWLIRRYPAMSRVGDDPENRPGIVHRLDRDASGVMVAAKDQRTFEYLKSLFKHHEIKKTYLALVAGVPREKEGIVTLPIGIRSGSVKRSTRSPKMAKSAATSYRTRERFARGGETFSLLEVKPQTGRTHQIRVHLASLGHPLLGDRLYGRKTQPPWVARLMLHALSLEFETPEGTALKIEAEPPEDFARILRLLRGRA